MLCKNAKILTLFMVDKIVSYWFSPSLITFDRGAQKLWLSENYSIDFQKGSYFQEERQSSLLKSTPFLVNSLCSFIPNTTTKNNGLWWFLWKDQLPDVSAFDIGKIQIRVWILEQISKNPRTMEPEAFRRCYYY